MPKNKMVLSGIFGVAVLAGAFFSGMAFAQSKNAKIATSSSNQPTQRQGRSGRFGGANSDFTAGDILSKDASSMTIKLRGGGSQIVYYSDKSAIVKSVAGTSADLAVGKAVMIVGKTNSDGSITADNISLRPEMMTTATDPNAPTQ